MAAAAPVVGALVGSYVGQVAAGYAIGAGIVGGALATGTFVAAGGAVGSMIGSSVASQIVGPPSPPPSIAMNLGAVSNPGLAAATFGNSPTLPEYSTALQDRGFLINTRNSVANLNVVYGERRIGGNQVFIETTGSRNQYLHIVQVLSEGEIEEITNVYLNDVVTTSSRFSGKIDLNKHLGESEQTADSELVSRVAAWTTDHRLQGVAYIYIRLEYDDDAFPTGLPVITADIKGRKIYDPRSSSTAWSDNPALCLRDYLTDSIYGRGIDAALIDDTSFIAAANYCDEDVTLGGETVKRYTCNGVLDTSKTSLENIREILTSCKGFLIFSGGKYKLVIDKPETATFTFSEDNIVGGWSIGLGNKNNTYNRIRANYYNKDRSWQPDSLIVESTTLRNVSDNGLILEREIEAPFTESEVRMKALATMSLNQSRQQVSCAFTATVEGMRCEVGDVVYISHATPGWNTQNEGAGKKFRIVEIAMMSNDEVRVKAIEYDETTYDFGTIPASDPTPNTNLPNPFTVGVPGLPEIVEALYVTKNGAGVKAKATVSWTESADIFVREYQVQYKLTSASTYTVAGRTSNTSFEVFDIAPGIYDFRVKAINSLSVSSEWKTLSAHEIFGLAAPPSALTNLNISAVSGLAVLTWDQSVDLDVRIGGKIEVRHSSLLTSATWANSVSLGTALNGTATVAILPLISGTYLVRAVDSSGIKSAVASITTEAATVQAFTTLDTLNAHPSFPGTKDDLVVVDNTLRIQGQEDMDDWSDVDSLLSWDIGEGGVDLNGTYYFQTGIDAGSITRQRVTRSITSILAQPLDRVDSRTANIDAWADFDGTDAAAGDCKVYVRHTDDDPAGSPTWSGWELLTVNEYNHRAFEFKAELSVNDPAYNIRVSELSVTAQEIA